MWLLIWTSLFPFTRNNKMFVNAKINTIEISIVWKASGSTPLKSVHMHIGQALNNNTSWNWFHIYRLYFNGLNNIHDSPLSFRRCPTPPPPLYGNGKLSDVNFSIPILNREISPKLTSISIWVLKTTLKELNPLWHGIWCLSAPWTNYCCEFHCADQLRR